MRLALDLLLLVATWAAFFVLLGLVVKAAIYLFCIGYGC